MIRAYFIPSQLTFIPEEWSTDGTYTEGKWPSDAVLLSPEETEKYWMTTPPDGKVLGVNKNGQPEWADIPPPTQEEITTQNESKRSQLKRTADSEIAWRQDAVDAEMATDDEVIALTAWKKYRVLLMRVDVNSPKWPKVPS